MGIEGLNAGIGGEAANGNIGAGDPTVTGGTPTELETTLHAARTGSPVEQGTALHRLDAATGNRQVSDAAVRGDAPAETCTTEVRFKPVIGPTNHAFIVTTDADSTNYFRGGPQSNNTGLNSSSSSSSGGGEQVPYDPNFGIYGPIVTEYGAYRPGTVDWTTQPTGQQTVAVTPGNCDAIEAQFSRHMDDIEAARINYEPLAANSNSTVRETLERAGFPDVSPVVWAPAWNSQLPLPH